MNIVEPILFQARHNPPAPAMCAPGAELDLISYGRLERFINAIGRHVLGCGVAPGHVVAIQVREHIFHAAIALALANIGVATVSVREPKFPVGLRIDAFVTDDVQSARDLRDIDIIPADIGWTGGDAGPLAAHHLYRGAGDAICRISFTSGSTGEAKAVAFSHGMQAARLARYNHAYGGAFPDCSRVFCDLGLPSSVGFRHLLYILNRGGTMFFPGQEPMDSLQTFGLYKVQGLIASPGGLSGFLKFYEEHSAFHSSFEIVIATGSALPASLSQRVRARLCDNLVYYYGTTETGTVSSAPAHALLSISGAVGFVAPGVKVEIVDDAGQVLAAGHEGTLRVRSPVNVEGYLGDPQLSAGSFRDGCFYTGDTGYLTRDGMLVVSGREKEILNLGGDKVKPEAIEEVLMAFGAIGQAAAFTVPNAFGVDEVWARIVPTAAFDENALRAFCQRSLPVGHVPVRLITVDRLPRNENGKIERHRLREGLEPAGR
jgi:acyl-coenzyme A synthetase/AMP-(fatty) acid ligase